MRRTHITTFWCLLFALPSFVVAQSGPLVGDNLTRTREEIIDVVKLLFDAMRVGDATTAKSVFDTTARLQTTFVDYEGKANITTESVADFVKAIGAPHDQMWDERVWSYDVRIDGSLATVWTEYTFYLGDKMSHCGVDAFQLFKSPSGWKIIQIADTRRLTDCNTDPSKEIHNVLDRWHLAAARADEDVFFGLMSSDAIYIGTDANERWARDDFRKWSGQYFDRDSAWVFHPLKRAVYLSDDGKMAWFEEHLDTWMGICRGSGVLTRTTDGWRIRHYVLSVAVPNDAIQAYIKLIKAMKAPVPVPPKVPELGGREK